MCDFFQIMRVIYDVMQVFYDDDDIDDNTGYIYENNNIRQVSSRGGDTM